MKRKPTKEDSLQFLRDKGLSLGTIIDVGVQKQTKELIKVFPDLKHILFEPVEEYYPDLAKNYQNIDHDLIKDAVSDKNGTAFLNVTCNTNNVITNSHIGDEKMTPLARTVDIIKLDSFFEKSNYLKPYLLHINVGNHETEILEGSLTMLKNVSCLVIKTSLSSLTERISFFNNQGFVLWDLVDLGYYYGNLTSANLIFISKSQKYKENFSPWQFFPFNSNEWFNLNKLFDFDI